MARRTSSTTYNGHDWNKASAELTQEARHILKTTVLDLDTFLALDSDAKACLWRQWDVATKRQAVQLMLTRKHGDWYSSEVDIYVTRYDAKWGAEPTPTEAAVAGALERLAEHDAAHARTARAQGLKDDAKFFQRQANAYARALEAYRDGIRPISLGRNKWLLPSRSDGVPHILTLDGDWTCSCAAGSTAHWAKMLIIALDQAREDMDCFDDATEIVPADLGRRLAEARMQAA